MKNLFLSMTVLMALSACAPIDPPPADRGQITINQVAFDKQFNAFLCDGKHNQYHKDAAGNCVMEIK